MNRDMHRQSEDKFKILLMTEAAGSGVGRHILDLAHGLAIAGHDVHLLYSPTRAEDRFLQRINELQGMMTITAVPMERAVSPRNDISTLIKIKEYVKANGPFDFIHGHSSKAGALARLLKATGMRSSRIIYTPHAFITLSPHLSNKEKLIYKTIERALGLFFTDAVVAVSHHEAQHAIELGIPLRKVNVIANGVETDGDSSKLREGYRDTIGVKDDDVVIGFSGRLDYQKAPEVLVRAFLSIEAGSNVHLILLGDGPKRTELEELAGEHRNGTNVHFLGYHPFAAAALNAMDIFVLPSRYEGLPYVLLEAMAASLPIIATSVGGNSELVRDGVNGLIVSPDSVDELAKALEMLVVDSKLREFFGKTSFEMVKDSYGTQLMIENTVNLYRRLRGAV
jgi:glycosyltransferase involved in cell wall biosynthesis